MEKYLLFFTKVILLFTFLFFSFFNGQGPLYQEGFEGTHGWTFTNGTQTNQWRVGNATYWSGTKSLYVSNDNGTSNAYTANQTSIVQAYKDIAIPAGTTVASLQFYFKCNGENNWDYFRVWLVPTTFTPTVGTQIGTGTGRIQVGGNFRNGNTNWYVTSYNDLNVSSFAGGNMRLVFEWTNDNSFANQPPAAIDNILLSTHCIPFTNGTSATYGDYIDSFTTTGGVTNISNTGSGYTNPPQGYGDFYNTHSVSQIPSGTINFSAVPGSNTYTHGLRVWVDWNKDGIFQNGEIVFTTATTATGTRTGSFVIPAGQAAGDYRMRVILRYNNTNIGACDTSYDGEAEDYKLTVNPAVTCNPVNATASKFVICSGETTTLSASSTTTGYTYTWYTDWNNNTHTGTLVGTGASVNVNPTSSTLYGVVATKPGCPTGVNAAYALISIAVTPPPTLVVLDPIEAVSCSNELSEINVVSGGNIPNEALDENFNPIKNPWTTNASVSAGGNASIAVWRLYPSGAIASPDNSDFAMVNSDAVGPYLMESSLVSSPISLLDYNTPINLTFNHYYSTYNQYPNYYSTATVEISEDGENWTVLKTYTGADVGGPTSFAAETINLNAYSGKPFLMLRFHYAGKYDDVWAIDDIKITGSPKPTTITWSPIAGLYTDTLGTAYTGGHATKLYASPANTTTYTISANTAVGCPTNTNVTVERGDKIWQGTTTDWATAANWTENKVPTADHCVKILSSTQIPTITFGTNAFAKNLTIESGGKLIVAGNLTVTDAITNTGLATDFIVKSDANLKQINEDPNINSTSISVRRKFKWSNNSRKEYNYLASPVYNQNMKTIFGGVASNVPYVLKLNESTNLFVNAATEDYAQKGKGFAVKEPTTSFVASGDIASNEAEFKGVPNNGTFTTPITKTVASRGWNLIGNPYPSNLDLQQFYQDNSTKILPEFRFWDNRKNSTYVQYGGAYQGYSYAIYNALSDVGNPAPGGDVNGDNQDPLDPLSTNGDLYQYAKVSQGFLVRASSATVPASADLTYKNTQRVVTPAEGFFGRNEVQKDLYRLQLITPDSLTLTQTILYIPNGLNSVGLEDSKHPSTNASDAFYSFADASKLLINAKAPFQVTDKVLLGNNHFTGGTYTIRAVSKLGVFANGQAIYLKDKHQNIITDLSQGDYSFNAAAGVFSDRFEIIYQPEVILATDGSTKGSLEVYRDTTDFVIRSSDKAIETMELFDASGRFILNQKGNGKELRFSATRLAEGMYVLKTTLKDGEVLTKKIRK